MPALLIKICGLSTPETVAAAADAGADLIGFVFHPKSPRYITPARAAELARTVPGLRSVALLVNPNEALLAEVERTLAPCMIQLHGQETPERVAAIRARGLPVMKAIGVAEAADLAAASEYASVADHLLIDAKPPKDAAYPGGHGRPFDWTILKALDPQTPFLLSGGLTPETVAEAIRTMHALGVCLVGVDVSSGVESAPGVKDVAKIRRLIAQARAAG